MPLNSIFFVQVWKMENVVDPKVRDVSFDLVILNDSGHHLTSRDMAWEPGFCHQGVM